MKTRYGFVSNSSSTSFQVAFNKKPTSEEIFEAMGISETSPFLRLAKRLAKYYADRIHYLESYENSEDDWDRTHHQECAKRFESTGLKYQGSFRAERDWCEGDQPLAGYEMPPIKNEKIYIVNEERGDME